MSSVYFVIFDGTQAAPVLSTWPFHTFDSIKVVVRMLEKKPWNYGMSYSFKCIKFVWKQISGFQNFVVWIFQHIFFETITNFYLFLYSYLASIDCRYWIKNLETIKNKRVTRLETKMDVTFYTMYIFVPGLKAY